MNANRKQSSARLEIQERKLRKKYEKEVSFFEEFEESAKKDFQDMLDVLEKAFEKIESMIKDILNLFLVVFKNWIKKLEKKYETLEKLAHKIYSFHDHHFSQLSDRESCFLLCLYSGISHRLTQCHEETKYLHYAIQCCFNRIISETKHYLDTY